uniref:NAD(+) diphosphatase n=1 Tax=Odontella aurita TaxID=265563 RepID=A0A7S4J8I6_9STRA|mmetsp:Transcript_41062/g.123996  ORF Transcript_41062/g.123996 Transcript_41062/m.123996 type:complete len:478 (+) Transcript_41062:199-1632(+)
MRRGLLFVAAAASAAAAFQRPFRPNRPVVGVSVLAASRRRRPVFGRAPSIPAEGSRVRSSPRSSAIIRSASTEEAARAEQPSAPGEKPRRPWYSDPSLGRDKTRVVKASRSSSGTGGKSAAASDEARFALFLGREAYHIREEDDDDDESGSAAAPLFLTRDELREALGDELAAGALTEDASFGTILAWVGEREGLDYWALRLTPAPPKDEADDDDDDEGLSRRLTEILRRRTNGSSSYSSSTTTAGRSPLREVGDGLDSNADSAVLATANGLLEFHSSHAHCSRCGSTTVPTKAGRSRRCTNEECRASVYPRIDAAAIMLVTSPCGRYALLGRKGNWPRGRYSTLAGFAEVGETLEECCVRETLEESGVDVDPSSVEFVASQPWPFPRSLMIGFRAKAEEEGTGGSEGNSALPEINFCEEEMDDVRWFHRDYVSAKLQVCEGSTALTYKPTEEEAEFHVPGKASLARLLILEWLSEQ